MSFMLLFSVWFFLLLLVIDFGVQFELIVFLFLFLTQIHLKFPFVEC